MAVTKLVEGVDYYFNEDGLMVFTKLYLQKRGYCCESGCRHCPYGFAVKTPLPAPPATSRKDR